MTGKLRVSVLILNYRNPAATVHCVQQFLQQTILNELEIIVIDNHSQDDSVGVLRNRFSNEPAVRIVETPRNGGFGYGYNYGARYVSGEYVLINNPDKLMPSDGVETLLARLEQDDKVGIIGPKMVHPDGSYRYSMRSFPRLLDIVGRRSVLGAVFPKHIREYLRLDANPDQEQLVDWVVGGCLMLRTSLLDELHGFDEHFFLFFEDTDLCRRCHLLGKSVLYFPQVAVGDKRRRLSGESLFDLLFTSLGRIHCISALKYFWKWRGAKAPRVA